jgi:lipoprotein-anchoring transpeptidase ErfK/SrfK
VNRGFRAALAAAVGAAGAALFVTSALADHIVKTHTVALKMHAVPSGVRVAGVRVGGLTPAAAAAAVRAAFTKPIPLVVNGKKVELHPAKLAKPYIDGAIGHARSSNHGTNIHLTVAVRGAAVRAAVAAVARRFDRRPHGATLTFVAGRPRIKPEVDGASIDQGALVQRVVHLLTANMRQPLAVRSRKTVPNMTAQGYGPVILINRSTNRLTLFHDDNTVWRVFPVATGQAIYPTPAGRFTIVVKQVDPWWYPPTYDSWAQGLSPVPPGPNNPLGTRWMGLSAPGVGIHGTDAPGSIGWNASHGCIRMQVVDSEWLFTHVKVGTTVFIT